MDLVTSDAQHARGLRASAASAQGPNRTRNQDAFFLAPAHGLFVLADGIGGLKHGERASWALVRAFEEALPLTGDFAARVAEIEARAARANAQLLEAGQTATPPYMMGSTLLALLIDGAKAACLWAGDSRLYHLHDHRLTQVTQDHSHWGHVSHTESPRSMLTRAVGVDAVFESETAHFTLAPGDVLLLCSDGVSGPLAPERIAAMMHDLSGDPAARLVEEAHRAGGRDDATAILIAITGESDPGPQPTLARGDTESLRRLERACWEIAHGNYGTADQLFELTVAEDASSTLRQLAESIGFMLVQIEAREMRLTGLVDDLRALHQELEIANRKLAQENAELVVTVERLRVDIDRKEFNREVGEIVETEYFQKLQQRARDMRARHVAPKAPADDAGPPGPVPPTR